MSGQNIEIVKLQVRRGPEAQLPILDQGEPAITTDTNKFFIGDGANNHQLANLDDLANVNSQLAQIVQQTTADQLQSVINSFASSSVKLTLQRQVYEISSTITIPSNIEIDFNLSTIKRKAGTGAFDLLRNADTTGGNTGIKLRNLILDGNKDVDGLVPTVASNRFSGLNLTRVTNSKLDNITVTKTVNGEDQADNPAQNPASGIYFFYCTDIDCHDLNGYSNDTTAIFVNKSRVRINRSLTHDNTGSGISSTAADESEYTDITTYNNGYTNLSVNGIRSRVSNVLSYGSSYSGVTLGHNGVPSDGTIATNIHSYNNIYEGITIGGSARVKVIGFEVHGNQRNNVRIFDGSTGCKLLAGTSRDSAGGQGVLIDTGTDHVLDDLDIYNNAISGIYVNAGVSAKIGSNNRVYNNGKVTSSGSAGLVLNTATNCEVGSSSFFDNQGTHTQESGIWIAGGSGHKLIYPNVYNNLTYQVRKTSSPTGIIEGYGLLSSVEFVNMTGANGWTGTATRYWVDLAGAIHFEGSFAGGTVGQYCFNLPVGLRPNKTMRFTTTANGAYAYLEISSNGNITPFVSNVAHYIDGITFKPVQ